MRRSPRIFSRILIGILASPSLWAQTEVAATKTPATPAITFTDTHLNEDDRAVLSAFIGHAVAFADKQTAKDIKTKCLKSPEMFAWTDFLSLDCLNVAYELTGNILYLDRFKDCFQLYREAMSNGPDKYLGWYGSPIPSRVPKDTPALQIDEIQMNFRAIAILSNWIEQARSNPAYAEKNATVIRDYLTLMENHLFPKWDARGFYTDLEKGGIYRGLDYPIEGGFTLSFEKLSIMVDGLLGLHRVTGNPAYLKRALQIGARFKNCLSLKDGHYEWMSWCPAGKLDISPDNSDAWKITWIGPDPNGPWYEAALSIALNLYQYGLLFSDEDLQRFIRTQKEICWNGNRENPEYRTVSGVSPAENKFVNGRFLSFQIAHYDPVLTQLAFFGPYQTKAKSDMNSEWKGGTNALAYIKEKYLMHPRVGKNPQPFHEIGARFLGDRGNKAFYGKLAFEVQEPGASIPLKPSLANF